MCVCMWPSYDGELDERDKKNNSAQRCLPPVKDGERRRRGGRGRRRGEEGRRGVGGKGAGRSGGGGVRGVGVVCETMTW